MTTVSFPGLNIGEFKIDPVAIRIPIGDGITIRWYGLIIVTGIILAFLYCAYRAKQEGIIFDDVLDIAIFTIIFAVLGARTYYVLTTLKTHSYKSFYDVIAIWEGGIAIYGAIIAGAATIFIVCRVKKISVVKMMDATALGVMIGQIVGRWGNFCNGEAFGEEIAEGSWLYFIRMGLNSYNTGYETMYVHPTFLYESLWNLAGFVLIHCLYKKKKFDGQIVLMYLTWYGFGRMLIESLRTDSLYIGVFRISQMVGLLCFVLGSIALTVLLIKARRKELDQETYAPAYKKISNPASIFEATDMEEDKNGEDN